MPTATPTEGVGTVEAPRGTLTHHYWDRRARHFDQSQPDRRYDQQLRTDQHVDQKAAQSLIKKGTVVNAGLLQRGRNGVSRLRSVFWLRDPFAARSDATAGNDLDVDGEVMDVLR